MHRKGFAMPYLNLKIAGAAGSRAISELAGQLTVLSTEVLGKKREVTALAVEAVPAGHWFVAGPPRACPAARMHKEMTMQMGLAHANIALEARHAMSLTDAAGAEVAVLKGQVWLTTDGDLRDIFLAPGEIHAIRRGGLTLINAVESSVLHVQAPRPARPWWKRWLVNVWDALAAAGEARARGRMKRGIYHF
jgi:phenylpyruvate tautomerase PptA (4-oxalocrotonate tautomerase family)